jgi:serine/threonine protein kinase
MPEHSNDRWLQIEGLYHRALEHDATARDGFLDETCLGDDALRREVQSLLGFERAADRFLERPALAEAAKNLAPDPRPGLIGRRLGGYEISTLLGTGGMGEVYRARDVRLGREVALKLLEPSIAADPAYLRRFEEEARSASVLNHPNIVTIYGVGEEGDIAFIAMELVQGRTLREHMSADVLPVKVALDLAVQLAGALTAAHASGIVHRDLKPENVMVTPEGLLKVLDFGIAKRQGPMSAAAASGDPAETSSAVTQVGTIIGTVGYMSPEQASGKPAGFASDQFSLGAILYEILSGRRAFQRDTRIDTLTAIIDSQPPPVESLNPLVPVSVRLVLERCLAKDPEGRYPNTRDLEVELRRIRDTWERQQTTDEDHAASRLTRGLTRRQVLWLGSAAAAAAIGGVATWRLWPPQTLAVLPFENAATDDDVNYLCIGITENLIWRISHLPIAVKPFSLVSNFLETSTDPRTVGRQLGVQTILTGEVTRRAGRLLISAELLDVATGTSLWKNSYDRSNADIFLMWDEIATAIVDDGLHLRLTREERRQLLSRPTDSTEAYDLFLRARSFQMNTTETDYLAARDLLERAVSKDGKFAEAWVALAGTYWTAALDGYTRPIDAWPQVDRSLGLASALNARLPDLHFGRAMKSFFFDWNWPAAEREWQIASEAPDRDIQPELLQTYAIGRWAMGHPEDSLRLVRQARHIDPLTPSFILMEATYLFHTGQLEAAANLYLTVINTHKDASPPRFGLAEVRAGQGRFDEAIAARTKGHELEGDDADDTLRDVLATARGEDGYRQIEKISLLRVEIPKLERRAAGRGYASPLDFARAYAQLADKERAFGYLKAAFDDRAPGLVFLRVDRAWDSIRTDVRFQDSVKLVGLP